MHVKSKKLLQVSVEKSHKDFLLKHSQRVELNKRGVFGPLREFWLSLRAVSVQYHPWFWTVCTHCYNICAAGMCEKTVILSLCHRLLCWDLVLCSGNSIGDLHHSNQLRCETSHLPQLHSSTVRHQHITNRLCHLHCLMVQTACVMFARLPN